MIELELKTKIPLLLFSFCARHTHKTIFQTAISQVATTEKQ